MAHVGRATALAAIALGSLLPFGLLAREYTSPEFVLTVVDEASRPVAGAIVLVTWLVTDRRYIRKIGMAKVFEGVTNGQGVLVVPAWTKRIPLGEIPVNQPLLRVFQAGRMPFVAQNDITRSYDGQLISVDWGQRPIVLPRVELPPSGQWTGKDEYIDKLHVLTFTMDFYRTDSTCLVDRIHLLYDALNSELDAVGETDRVGWTVSASRSGCP